jgi:hypothetical protein
VLVLELVSEVVCALANASITARTKTTRNRMVSAGC